MMSFACLSSFRPLSRQVVLGLGAFACLATTAAADSTILATRYPELQQLLLACAALEAGLPPVALP